MEVSDSTIESVATKVVQGLGYEDIKHEQLQIVTGALRGHNMLAWCAAYWFWEPFWRMRQTVYTLDCTKLWIVLVVSPLMAINKDLVSMSVLFTKFFID